VKKYYVMQENGAEIARYTIHPEDESDGAWEAVCHRMAELLREWIDAASTDMWIGTSTFEKFDDIYGKWDLWDGQGVELPYELVLPATGILPEQVVNIWEESEAPVANPEGTMIRVKPDAMLTLDPALIPNMALIADLSVGQEKFKPLENFNIGEMLNGEFKFFAAQGPRLRQFEHETVLVTRDQRQELYDLRKESAELRPKANRLDATREYLLKEWDKLAGAADPHGGTMRRIVGRALYVLEYGTDPLLDRVAYMIFEAGLSDADRDA